MGTALRYVVFSLAGVALAVGVKWGFGIQATTNGSMPSLGLHSLVVTARSDSFVPGDVITFETTAGVELRRVHQVRANNKLVTTSDSPGEWVVDTQDVVGKKLAAIPRAGAWFEKDFWVWKAGQPSFLGGVLGMVLGGLLVFLCRNRKPTNSRPGRHRARPS